AMVATAAVVVAMWPAPAAAAAATACRPAAAAPGTRCRPRECPSRRRAAEGKKPPPPQPTASRLRPMASGASLKVPLIQTPPPALEPGKEFNYTLKGEIVRDGKTVTASQRITVRAGEETRVNLEFPTARVAQR